MRSGFSTDTRNVRRAIATANATTDRPTPSAASTFDPPCAQEYAHYDSHPAPLSHAWMKSSSSRRSRTPHQLRTASSTTSAANPTDDAANPATSGTSTCRHPRIG